jgi:Pyruvate/2-oxoacid:ferredoxin oxidoreductase delta subunit
MSLLHAITAEHSRFRKWTLHLFARYVELPLLWCGYHLLRGRYQRLGRFRLVRAILGWAVAAPFGYAGDTARPMPASELIRLIGEMEGPLAVGPCRCRAAHRGCDHPLETDIVIRTGVETWTRAFPREYRLIDKEEARQIVSDCAELGMWPMVFVHCPVHAHTRGHGATDGQADPDLRPPLPSGLVQPEGTPAPAAPGHQPMVHQNEYVICNCCTCGCVPFILNRELGQRLYPLLRGAYEAVTDPERCAGHGNCIAACPFEVRTLVDGQAQQSKPCFGCGVCVNVCPEAAITMRAA